MKKFLSIILCVAMLCSVFPVEVLAENNSVNTSVITVATSENPSVSFDGGDGTVNNPYLISTEAQLGAVGDNLRASYKLTKNIILTTDWVPIGGSYAFRGVFDGNGYKIASLNIPESAGEPKAGLFGVVDTGAEIRSVVVEIKEDGEVSAAGESVSAGALVGENYGTITNSYATGKVSVVEDTLGGLVGVNASVGGLVGENYGTITNSYANGSSCADSNSGDFIDAFAGGLVGTNHSGGTITGSHATGNVNGTDVGGLVGSNSGEISECFATGSVCGGLAGGLVSKNRGIITKSYATGNSSAFEAGGLVGENNGTISNSYATGSVTDPTVPGFDGGYIGGLVSINTGTITNCYAIGVVIEFNSLTYYGGLVGSNSNYLGSTGTISNSYYDMDTSGRSDTDKGGAKFTSEMFMTSTYTGWDFEQLWGISPSINNGYPYLLCIPPDSGDSKGAIQIIFPLEGTGNPYDQMLLTLINISRNTKQAIFITNNLKYVIPGLDTSDIFKITITNKYGQVIDEIDNIELSSGRVDVAVAEMSKPKTVNLTVKDNLGKAIINGITVKWYGVDNKYILHGNSISELPQGTSLFYEVLLDGTLGSKYIAPEKQSYTVVDGDNNIELHLSAIPEMSLSGKAIDKTNNTPLKGAVVSISQLLNGKYPSNTIVTTDSNGLFSALVFKDVTNITISKNSFVNQTLSDLQTNYTGNNYDTGEIKLSPVSGAKITLNMSYTYSSLPGTTPVKDNAYYDSSNVKFTVFNQTQNKQISNFSVQYPYMVLLESVNSSDEVIITATSVSGGDVKAVQTSATFDSHLTATAQLDFVQNGSYKATYTSSENTNNVAIVYDSNEKYVKTYDFNNKTATSDGLADGNYEVVFIGKSLFLNNIQNLSDLSEVGLVENTDYLKQQVLITSGEITVNSNVAIPKLDESKLYYTDSTNMSFTINKSKAVAGSYFSLRNQYAFKNIYKNQLNNIKVIYSFPSDFQLMQNSVLVGNYVSSNYVCNNNTLTVPVLNTSDVVRFCAMPTIAGSYSINAFLQFEVNGITLKQPIGAVSFEATALTIDVPEKTAQKTVRISGITSPNSEVTIYDNNVVVGQSKSLLNGSWSLDFELYQPYTYSSHDIYAEGHSQGGIKIISETKQLIYDLNYVEVSKVTMVNIAHPATSLNLCEYVTEFNYLHPASRSPVYWYWSGYPTFTFKLEFTNNDPSMISNVFINVWTYTGNVVTIPAIFDDSKKLWIASGDFDSNNLPVNVSVNYDTTNNGHLVDLNQGAASIRAVVGDSYIAIEDDVNAKFVTDDSLVINIISESDNSNLFEYAVNSASLSLDDILSVQNDISYSKGKSVDGGMLYSKWIIENNQCLLVLIDELKKQKNEFRFEIESQITNNQSINNYQLSNKKYLADITSGNEVTALFDKLETTYKIINENYDNAFAKNTKLQFIFNKYGHLKDLDDNATKVIDYGLDALWFVPKEQIRLMNELNSSTCLTQDQRNILTGYVSAWGAFAPSVNSAQNQLRELAGLTAILKKLKLKVNFESPTRQAFYEKTIEGLDKVLFGWLQTQIDNFFNDFKNVPDAILDLKVLMENNNGCNDPFKPTPKSPHTRPANPVLDPSGYVYEAVVSNRVSGVTATIFYKQNLTDTTATLWDAAEYQQENPLTTDVNGGYAWDVPLGWWQVKYEKDGYQTTYSDWLPVPPPQVDVNIAITSFAQPNVVRAIGYEGYVEIFFDKYMQTSTLTTDNITLTNNGTSVAGTLQMMQAEVNLKYSSEQVATKVHFIPTSGQVSSTDSLQLTVSNRVKSYAKVHMDVDYTATVAIQTEPQTITATDTISVAYGGSGIIQVSVSPKEAATGKIIKATSSSPSIATVDAETTLDSNGNASIPVTANMTGTAYITVSLYGTDMQAQSTVNVAMPVAQVQQVSAPVSSVPAGTVPANTPIELFTATSGATIYYTTDGTCPLSSATRQRYTGPKTISSSTTIIAVAIKEGMTDSAIMTAAFIIEVSDTDYSAIPIVQIGINPDKGDSAGIFVGIKDIRDAQGDVVTAAELASYQIELVYSEDQVKVFEVVDEAHLGEITLSNTPNTIKVSVNEVVDQGTGNFERLFFVPLALTGTSSNPTNVIIKFINLNDINLNPINILDVSLTFQRGKILNEADNSTLSLVDAVAGLQYLANLVDSGIDTGKVNVINMASIQPPEVTATGLNPRVTNVIALMQKLAGLRDDTFQVIPRQDD